MSNKEDALTCKRTIPPTEQTFSLLVSTQYGVQENPFSTEEGAPKANGVYYRKIPDGILSIYVPVIPTPTLGQHWLLKQFSLNHPVEHIQKPKLPKLYVRVETSTSYFIIHNQFVK